MFSGERSLLATVMITALLPFAAGCMGGPTGPPTLAQWAAAAGPDLNCPGKAIARPGSVPQYYDITGDRQADTFVDLICDGTDATTTPDQVEVFEGTSRSSRLARLTSIAAPPDQQVFLAHGCVYFTGNRVIVIGRMRPVADPGVAATVLAMQISTWTGGKINTGRPRPLPAVSAFPPGCA